MVNHFSKKGYLSELEDTYLSRRKAQSKTWEPRQASSKSVIYKPEHLTSLNKHVNELYEGIPLDKNTKKRINAKHAPHYSITGPMTKPGTLYAN